MPVVTLCVITAEPVDSNPCQNKKAYIDVTLHSVCEVREFGQDTVE